jgi:DNA-directed RNA polymerase subunit RPC12/RpoP
MVKFKCRACGKTIELPQRIDTDTYEDIDTDDYDGQVVCQECKALLHMKLVKGKVRKCKIVERLRPGAPVEFRVTYDNDKEAPKKR